MKTYEEINQKIKNKDAVVVTAEEMIDIVEKNGPEKAAEEVDVVTTGTFGAMCSSGAFLNFGHSDPPIKMEHVWLNGVHAYHGNAAVDCYIGVTRMSDKRPFKYGGGHVIEDLLTGKPIKLRGTAFTTDCMFSSGVSWVMTQPGATISRLYPASFVALRTCSAASSGPSVRNTPLWSIPPNTVFLDTFFPCLSECDDV